MRRTHVAPHHELLEIMWKAAAAIGFGVPLDDGAGRRARQKWGKCRAIWAGLSAVEDTRRCSPIRQSQEDERRQELATAGVLQPANWTELMVVRRGIRRGMIGWLVKVGVDRTTHLVSMVRRMDVSSDQRDLNGQQDRHQISPDRL